jgi:O-methyltransferase involved in polyketide biosynthesis
MNRDDVHSCHDRCERPVCVAARAAARAATRIEREKVAEWMMQRGYATGHGEAIEDLLAELDWQIRESEREACAQMVLSWAPEFFKYMTQEYAAHFIRARGQG